MKLTNAIILSAGLGTRMRPLTLTKPKPLIEVAGQPLIDHCLDWVSAAGIERVVVNTSYLAEQLEAHLATRVAPKVQFSREEPAPLETGGGIAKALTLLGNAPFLAMNSDAIIPPQASHPIAMLEAAWGDDIDFLMLVVHQKHAIGWEKPGGDFVMDENRVRRPQDGEVAPYVFTGVEIIHPRAFLHCPEGAFSLSRLWNKQVDAGGFFTRVRAIEYSGPWLNVGDLAGLKAAEDYWGSSAGKRK